MKIETNKKTMSKEELYQVGNVIEECGDLYLVIKVYNENGPSKYGLVDLKANYLYSDIHNSLKELADDCYTTRDRLVRGKLVIDD